MAALDWVEQDFGGLLDTFEERVVVYGARCGLFVWMMAQDLFAVSTLDLVFCGLIAVFLETEDGVMVLILNELLAL